MICRQPLKFCVPYPVPVCHNCKSALITHESRVTDGKVHWQFYCPLCLAPVSRDVVQVLDKWVQLDLREFDFDDSFV